MVMHIFVVKLCFYNCWPCTYLYKNTCFVFWREWSKTLPIGRGLRASIILQINFLVIPAHYHALPLINIGLDLSMYSTSSQQRKSHSSQQRKIRHIHGGAGKAVVVHSTPLPLSFLKKFIWCRAVQIDRYQ